MVVTRHLSCNTLASSLQTSVLCGMNTTKIPALQSDSVKVLSELTDSNTVAVVVQNSLETTRYSPSSNVVVSSNDVCICFTETPISGYLYLTMCVSRYEKYTSYYTCVCAHVRVCVCCVRVLRYTMINEHTCTCTHTRTHTHTHTHMHTHAHAHTHTRAGY